MASYLQSTDETDLVRRCIRRERAAQKLLYDTFSPRMYPICCRYVRDPVDAEDVLVTAFTQILDKIGQFRGDGSLEGWIKRIVVNEALTFLRKKKRLFAGAPLEDIDDTTVAQQFHDPLVAEDLLKMISTLPPGYRTVFNLYAIDGYSHQEIAEQLGINENTSKSQLSRARAYLQKVLADRDRLPNSIQHDIAS